ncbi:hypothetical protein [Hymenobacter negativus]|uniref:Secreted protein n=1 Tax=Hymenobacter negativus TaxID=2795026 RepID=A0ABS3QAH7_9BACT|nr:hypothetical protein [Hymenobacter negativus]MBO2008246.1 hypothetical protein [Hymenobacter negativus]
MKRLFFLLFPVVLLVAGAMRPVAAQTARIAHFSHSGSAATLDAAVDNFGTPPSHFVADSIEILSDSTAREYGKWMGYHSSAEKTNIVQFAYPRRNPAYGKSVKDYIAGQQKYRPQVKVIKHDTVTAATKPGSEIPAPKKQKTKRKKSAFLPATPAPPQHPGVALAVAAILVLTGAGWLLGERRPAQPQAV